MRLDKFFSQTGTLTRSQVQKQLKLGKVTVNGEEAEFVIREKGTLEIEIPEDIKTAEISVQLV